MQVAAAAPSRGMWLSASKVVEDRLILRQREYRTWVKKPCLCYVLALLLVTRAYVSRLGSCSWWEMVEEEV